MDLDSPIFVERIETIEKNLEEKKVNSNNKKTLHSHDQKKTLFIDIHKIKLLNAVASARKATVKIHTGKAWSARMKEGPNMNICKKQTNQNKLVQTNYRKSIKLFLLINLMCSLQLELKMQLMAIRKTSNFSLKETVVGK